MGIWSGALLLCGFGILLFLMGYFGGFREFSVADVILLVYTLGGGAILILVSRIAPSPVRGVPIFVVGLVGMLIPLALKYAVEPGFFHDIAVQGGGPGKFYQFLLITGGVILLIGGARVTRLLGSARPLAVFVKSLGGVLLAVGLMVPFEGSGSILIEVFRFKTGAQAFGAGSTLWFLSVLFLAFGALVAIVGYNVAPAATISYVSTLLGLNLPLLIFLLDTIQSWRISDPAAGATHITFFMLACYVYPIIYAMAGGIADLTGPAVAEEIF